ncbi:Ypt/Rab-GAP domain of gyp1p superfamily protein isoform 2 [Capsicum annuum]|uniref:TBC1 domain family member 8B isoform X2 n=1 Tax=Capsicum annuum TaxID=4072 RepID=UPI0007BF9CD3|nr:TBC1 domain family member 8B isoform X2 [Capsicum annuum]KAF3627591.1 Ypt/Rab-GAP domain of gyp1p superfamily protein isoform 2 [Capsicum annuum]KAF3637179.1 Ypt/Rab-GAP domain of gyp1p superfamily protein isoform 2 [Capsicum annuum]
MKNQPFDHPENPTFPKMTVKNSPFFPNFEPKRDAYGFTVRPQHLQRYREYATIYREEEEERSEKWKDFLDNQEKSSQPHASEKLDAQTVDFEVKNEQQTVPVHVSQEEGDGSAGKNPVSDIKTESDLTRKLLAYLPAKSCQAYTWAEIRASLSLIDHLMSFRVKTRPKTKVELSTGVHNHLATIKEREEPEEENGEESSDNEELGDRTNTSAEVGTVGSGVTPELSFPWKELEFLVHGGVPRDLRGEVWQAFVGVRARRLERYYFDLLDPESDTGDGQERDGSSLAEENKQRSKESVHVPEKLRKQIEKDLPRTFPGHPALDEKGRNSLRRLLIAYARHNPDVGYCQAMNFFAGILLLMMPEENAFWALVGLIDEYFGGCYSQEMIESQVDQLVFEELVRERFPKLVYHLEYLGMQVAWISGPWFLSIFVNVLPWESVLRVWDVLLFEGNRVMLFRTALALMELYGPAVVTTKDAGDAITLFQSLTGSTFDSSQLVLTACMGFLNVTEDRLLALREKHRPAVLAVTQEKSTGGPVKKDPKGLASKLYSFKHDPESFLKETKPDEESGDKNTGNKISDSNSNSASVDEFLNSLNIDSHVDSLPGLQEQVVWLKVELCRTLEDKRAATLRAEELETALMEMVKEDNRRQLSARVEQLEQEVAELRLALNDKKEQEKAMLEVLMRVEQEQKVTEDARIAAEHDVAAQKYAVHVLQEKYEKAMASVADMEKRVVMAESMLEATLQYESGQVKAPSSPRATRPDSPQGVPAKRTGLLSFGLGWRDRNKAKPTNLSETKSADEDQK